MKVLLLLMLAPFTVLAPQGGIGGMASVTLAWDATEKVDGFRVYYREPWETNYTKFQDAGTNTWLRVVGLKRRTTYRFACTAYRAGLESDFSEEVSYRTAASPSWK